MNDILKDAKVVLVPAEKRTVVERRVKRRRTAAILCGVLIPVVVLTIFFSVMLNARDLGVGEGNLDEAYDTVLADIDGITEANPRIIDIAMLGAHDANTFSVSADGPIDDNPAGEILKTVLPASSGFQYRMSVTQVVSPYRLLMQGARMLHFKFAYYDGGWYASHSLLGRKFELDIIDVMKFLDEYPGEFVILFFQSTYYGPTQSLHTFHEWLASVEYNGKNIYDFVHYGDVNIFGSEFVSEELADLADLTYNDVTKNGTEGGVVLFDRREEIVTGTTEPSDYTDLFFDVDANSAARWHNRMGEDVLIENINDYADTLSVRRQFRYYLRVNQAQGTISVETAGDLLRSIGAWSLVKFAEKYNASLLDDPNFDKWLRIMPVVQVDFANSDYGDFNRRINAKIRARNEEIVRILGRDGATYEDLYR